MKELLENENKYYKELSGNQEKQIEQLQSRIDKANWWLKEMLKQARNDETKAIINGAMELLLGEDTKESEVN